MTKVALGRAGQALSLVRQTWDEAVSELVRRKGAGCVGEGEVELKGEERRRTDH